MLFIVVKKIKSRIFRYLEFNHTFTLLRIKFAKEIKIGKGRFIQKVIFWNNGSIEIGDNFVIGFKYGGGFDGRSTELQTREKNARIVIGSNLATNNGLFICARNEIVLGDNCLIGSQVTILDHNGHGIHPDRRRRYSGKALPIKINDNVWIGNNVHILPGTIIGKNCIVGVGSVVKGTFPDNVIIQGNPALIIKKIII